MGMGSAYEPGPPPVPEWVNKGDNAWQLMASTLVGMQAMPGLVVLYGSIVKKKWAVNSAFMALYAFAASLILWVLVGYRIALGDRLLPFWGKAGPALAQGYLVSRAALPATARRLRNRTVDSATATEPLYQQATLVYFEFTFAAITLVLLAGSVLGRMNTKARVDGVRAAVAALLLHSRRLQLVGRRIPLPLGGHRLLRRLRHPPLLRRRRLHRRILGGSEAKE